MIKAILFDMDGLLVDTETLGVSTAIQVCNSFGIKLSKDEQEKFVGIPVQDFYKNLFKKRKLEFDVEEILQKQFERYETLLRKKLNPFLGAIELLQKTNKSGYKTGLVSGSTKWQIEIILDKLNINKYFDVIISYNDVENGKPNPESYILAAKRLSVLPQECVVIEDAEAGVIAAKSADMKVIGVKHNTNQNLNKADVVVTDLTKLLDINRVLKNEIHP